MQMAKGLFSGVGSAKVVNSEYIKPGEVLFRVDRTKTDVNRKKETIVVVEGTVIHDLLDGESEMRVGEAVSQVLKPASDYFDRDVKAFVCAALGYDINDAPENEITEAAESIFGTDDNILCETVLHLSAKNIVTQKGGDFTKITWKGEVAYEDLPAMLSEREIERFYPNGKLDALIEQSKNAKA
jgi:hypothetical protein